jgi:hypothetical protein
LRGCLARSARSPGRTRAAVVGLRLPEVRARSRHGGSLTWPIDSFLASQRDARPCSANIPLGSWFFRTIQWHSDEDPGSVVI